MHSTWRRLIVSTLFLIASIAAAQPNKINPDTQIRWPMPSCANGQGIYNPAQNTCVRFDQIPPTNMTWPLPSCGTSTGVYNPATNSCIDMAHQPPSNIVWPPTCTTGVYSPSTNSCIVPTTGTAANPAPPSGYIQWNNSGLFDTTKLIGYDPTYGPATKLPDIYPTNPDFSVGMPIDWVTLSGNTNCTSGTPTVTFSNPVYPNIATPAKGTAACIFGKVVMQSVFGGAGYDNTATATITGAGVSGIIATPTFACTARPADPTGTLDSTCAIQQAINYAYFGSVFASTLGRNLPAVQLPPGSFTAINLQLPTQVDLRGAGMSSTTLLAGDPIKNLLTRTPYQEALSGTGTPNTGGYGNQGHVENMTLSTRLYAVVGQPPWNNGGFRGTFFEEDNTYDRLNQLQFINGAGRGLSLAGVSEEFRAFNIFFGAVRYPVPITGQAGQVMVGMAASGAGMSTTSGGAIYCYSTDCANGYWWSQNFGSSNVLTLTNLSTDGAGNFTVTVQCTACNGQGVLGAGHSSPIAAQHWFTLSGITASGFAWANGTFKATAISDASSGNPATFTITSTYNATTDPDAGIQSGGTVDFTPAGAPTLQGATLQTPASASTSSPGGTFQIASWPKINTTFRVRGESGLYEGIRCTSTIWANCLTVEGSGRVTVKGVYAETAPVNNMATLVSAVQVIGYQPHAILAATFSATQCAQQSLCAVALTPGSAMLLPNYVGDPRRTWQVFWNANNLALMPADYCPSCTGQPSTAVPGVNRDQFEMASVAVSGDGNAYFLSRNASGSTAPANTPWPAGTLLGYNKTNLFSSNYPGTDISEVHANVGHEGTNLYAAQCNDAGPNACATYWIGPMYDGHGITAPPQTGGITLTTTTKLQDIVINRCQPYYELIGIDCVKASNNSQIVIGQGVYNGGTSQLAGESTGPASGQLTIENTIGVIATQYPQPYTSIVNTSGATVTRVSGGNFTGTIPGDTVNINGTNYTVLTLPSTVSLTVSPSPGTLTNATMTATPILVSNISVSDTNKHSLYSTNSYSRLLNVYSTEVNTGGATLQNITNVPNSFPSIFAGKQFSSIYAITDSAGYLSQSVTVTSWTRSGNTFTMQGTNTLTAGNCVQLSGLVTAAILNNGPTSGAGIGCWQIGSPTGSQFTVTYTGPPLSSVFPTSGTENATANLWRNSIMLYFNGGPWFTGAAVCGGWSFTTAVNTSTPFWKICGSSGNATATITEQANTSHVFGQLPTFPNQAAHTFFGNITGSSAAPTATLIDAYSASVPSYIADTGAVNQLVATLNPAPSGLANGLMVRVLPANANTTTTPTLFVNGLVGAKTITKCGTLALAVGDLTTTAIASFLYDGTRFQLQNPQAVGCGAVTLLIGTLTTTAAATDNVALTGMTASGHCTAPAPTNSAAASAASVAWVSAKTTNQITVTHATTASMTYDIQCTPN